MAYYQQQPEEPQRPDEATVKQLDSFVDELESCPLVHFSRELYRRCKKEIERFRRHGKELSKQRLLKWLDKPSRQYDQWKQLFQPFHPPDVLTIGQGDISIGNVKETPFINALDIRNGGNVIILAGPPNVGKTTLLHQLIIQMAMAGHYIHMFSPKVDELLKLFPWFKDKANFFIINKLPWFENPAEPPIDDPQWISRLEQIWPGAFLSGRAYYGQTYRGLQELSGIKAPSMLDHLRYTNALRISRKNGGLASPEYSDHNALQRQSTRLRELLQVRGYSVRKGYPYYPGLMNRHNFLLYSNIGSSDVRNFFVRCVLMKMWMAKKMTPELRQKRLDCFVLDDAQEQVLATKQRQEKILDAFEDIALNGRSDGTRLILSVQDYALIEPSIRRTASTIIAFSAGYDNAVALGGDMRFDRGEQGIAQIKTLMGLSVGECLVWKRFGGSSPVLTCFEDFQAEPVSQEVIGEYMRPEIKRLMACVEGTPPNTTFAKPDMPVTPSKNQTQHSQSQNRNMTTQKKLDSIMGLLQAKPTTIQEDIAEVFGMSIQSVSRMMQTLIEDNLIEIALEFRGQGSGGIKFYRFTKEGEKWGKQSWPGHGDLRHSCGVKLAERFYKKRYPHLVYTIRWEKDLKNGHFVDLCVGNHAGIEIAHRSKASHEIEDCIIPCLQFGFAKVISASFDVKMRNAIQAEAQRKITDPEMFNRCEFVLVTDFLIVKGKRLKKELLIEEE